MRPPSFFPPTTLPVRSPIPGDAIERVIERYDGGAARRSEFVMRGKVVAGRLYDDAGFVFREWGERGGKLHGLRLDWYERGVLIAVTPFQDGLEHGTAIQLNRFGVQIGCYEMDRGNGWDLWWEDHGGTVAPFLSEARQVKDGQPDGFEWWINDDQATVSAEHHYSAGRAHGIERRWNADGRLEKGYPRFFVADKRLAKARYLTASARDSALPRYAAADDGPARKLPREVRAALRRPGATR